MSTPAVERTREGLQAPEAWVRLLRAQSALTRRMDADLAAAHGLTLSDYEVLLYLSHAPEHRLRRVDLAQQVPLTQSGITRLLEGLERSGLVARRSCPEDGRVVYAQLTAAGLHKLRAAAATHRGGIEALFSRHFSGAELEALSELLGRLPGTGEAGTCSPGE